MKKNKYENNVLASLLGLGWQITIILLLFILGGLWLDSYLKTSPWFTLGGALISFVHIFYELFKYTERKK